MRPASKLVSEAQLIEEEVTTYVRDGINRGTCTVRGVTFELVPDIVDLGLTAYAVVDDVGDPMRVVTDLADLREMRLIFCEGFATGVDGSLYKWEVLTRDEFTPTKEGQEDLRLMDEELFQHTGYQRPAPRTIARLPWVGGRSTEPLEVVELFSDLGEAHTQVVVPDPWFATDLLDRLQTASTDERGIIFSRVNDA